MGKPGSGRYTSYVPVETQSANRYNKRLALFNNLAPEGKGDIYPGADLVEKAAKLVTAAAPKFEERGDTSMFPTDASANRHFENSPILSEVTWATAGGAGGPANPYVPDVRSPGPKKTNGTDKTPAPSDGQKDPAAYINQFETFVPGNTDGTKSPNTTATGNAGIGVLPLGKELQQGKSGIKV